MRNAPLAILCLAALSLSACERGTNTMAANDKICINFKEAKAPLAAPGADGAAAVEQCVQRWAYSLAASNDDADTVAEAASVACATQLSRWNQATLNQPTAEGEATSLITGQPTTPLAEHSAFSRSRALFYVVQARAGHCSAPPAKDGVPEGIT